MSINRIMMATFEPFKLSFQACLQVAVLFIPQRHPDNCISALLLAINPNLKKIHWKECCCDLTPKVMNVFINKSKQ